MTTNKWCPYHKAPCRIYYPDKCECSASHKLEIRHRNFNGEADYVLQEDEIELFQPDIFWPKKDD